MWLQAGTARPAARPQGKLPGQTLIPLLVHATQALRSAQASCSTPAFASSSCPKESKINKHSEAWRRLSRGVPARLWLHEGILIRQLGGWSETLLPLAAHTCADREKGVGHVGSTKASKKVHARQHRKCAFNLTSIHHTPPPVMPAPGRWVEETRHGRSSREDLPETFQAWRVNTLGTTKRLAHRRTRCSIWTIKLSCLCLQ